MVRLIRDARTGDYYSENGKFFIERGTSGWNVSELNEERSNQWCQPVYEYSFTCDTLKEVRESI